MLFEPAAAELPEGERQACKRFWEDVREPLSKAQAE
jgi:hypothetical protein